MYCELLPILDEDIVVLTANRRLSHHLHQQFDQYQLTQAQKTFWHTPKILPLNKWLADCWQQHWDCSGTLLSDFQEAWCWQTIIRNSKDTSFLLSTTLTATLVKAAWDMLTLWNIELNELEQVNEEVKTFVTWAQEFQEQKQQHQWLCTAELPKALHQLVTDQKLSLPPHILFVGFDEFSPAVRELIDEIKTQTKVTEYSPDQKKPMLQQIRLADAETEITTMARWAKKQLEQNPNQRIGFIVPNLTKRRKAIDRLFTQVFALSKNPFNISAGQALNTFPIIRCALNILALKPSFMAFEDLSPLLRSIYINTNSDDACLAAQLERKFRELNQLHINAATLLPYLGTLKNSYPNATFPQRWEAFLNSYSKGKQQSPSKWSNAFIDELTQLGWPGQLELASHEYQIVKRFEKIFEEFAQTESFISTLSREQALQMFQQLVGQTIFQPENPEESIQILGILEATGLEFDQMWIMGLNNEDWPPPANPNPFLPIHLQRQHRMPHASANRELEYTQHLQQRLFNSAPNIIISSPIQEKDKQLSPSRLIQHIPVMSAEHLDLPVYKNSIEKIFESKKIELINDAKGPVLQHDEKFRGGSWVLQQQSLCPFRAFAAGRLKAESLPEPQLGLTASERGTLVHQALEHVWKKLKTQEQLKSYSQTNLKALVKQTVSAVIENYPCNQAQFLAIENKRIVTLIMEWLEFEKKRPSFSVDQRESIRFIKVGELPLQLKIDRIDKLADGSNLIIDYKTGLRNNIDDWFGDRPKALQLPLYCVYGTRKPFGLAYAQVRQGHIAFKGIIASDENNKSFFNVAPLSKLKKTENSFDWKDILQHWRDVLMNLSSAFCAGQASVDPVDLVSVCKYCDLHLLCRIGSQYDDK